MEKEKWEKFLKKEKEFLDQLKNEMENQWENIIENEDNLNFDIDKVCFFQTWSFNVRFRRFLKEEEKKLLEDK